MMKERGRGGVVQNFQTGGSDPAKEVISERVGVDKSEDTTTSVMNTGGNRALSTECSIRAEGIITRDLKLFG